METDTFLDHSRPSIEKRRYFEECLGEGLGKELNISFMLPPYLTVYSGTQSYEDRELSAHPS